MTREAMPQIEQEEISKIIQIYFKNDKTDNCLQIKGALANAPYENLRIMVKITNNLSNTLNNLF